MRAGGSHLRYRIGVPADRSDGEAGLGSRRGISPPAPTTAAPTMHSGCGYIDGHMAFSPQDVVGGIEGLPSAEATGLAGTPATTHHRLQWLPQQSAGLDLRDLRQGQENDGAVPHRPASGRADAPMDGPGEEGPNHEPPTGRYGEGLGPAVVPVVRLCRLLPRGATCPIARCLNRPRGRDELTVCAPRQHRTALLSMPRAGPTRRGRGRSRMGTGPAPSTLGLPDDQ